MDSEAAELFLQIDGLDDVGVLLVTGDILVVVEFHAHGLQLVDGALHGVGADGDVAQLAQLGIVVALDADAGEVGGIAGLVGEAEQLGEQLSGLGGLLTGLAVHAHMTDLEAQHGVDGLAAQTGDLVPVLGLNEVGAVLALEHPGAADGGDLVEAQVLVDILGRDAAGAHPLQVLVGAGAVLQEADAAVGLGGEELQNVQTHADGLLHLAQSGGAGDHQTALVDDVLGQLGDEAGGDQEGAASGQSAVSLLVGDDGAGAQQHLGDLGGDGLDGILSGGGAEGDLGGGQTTGDQSLGQGNGLGGIIDGDDGDNANLGNHFQSFLLCFSVHGNLLLQLFRVTPIL